MKSVRLDRIRVEVRRRLGPDPGACMAPASQGPTGAQGFPAAPGTAGRGVIRAGLRPPGWSRPVGAARGRHGPGRSCPAKGVRVAVGDVSAARACDARAGELRLARAARGARARVVGGRRVDDGLSVALALLAKELDGPRGTRLGERAVHPRLRFPAASAHRRVAVRLDHAPPAGPGTPAALPECHSRVQLAGISAPSRYRSR